LILLHTGLERRRCDERNSILLDEKTAISYQVIPKSLWENKRQQEQQQEQDQQHDQQPSDQQQQQQQEEPIGSPQEIAAAETSQQTNDDAILSALLERKRKNFHTENRERLFMLLESVRILPKSLLLVDHQAISPCPPTV
jgi:ATPase subunit of ABC transporter with duplicated ATPase domains